MHFTKATFIGKRVFLEPKHPILENIGITAFDYVIKSANEVHQQELESALLLLPIEYLLEFMNLLCDAIDQKKSVERVSVILNALQRICSKFPPKFPTRTYRPPAPNRSKRPTGFGLWIPVIEKIAFMNGRFEPYKIIPSTADIIPKICECFTKS